MARVHPLFFQFRKNSELSSSTDIVVSIPINIWTTDRLNQFRIGSLWLLFVLLAVDVRVFQTTIEDSSILISDIFTFIRRYANIVYGWSLSFNAIFETCEFVD